MKKSIFITLAILLTVSLSSCWDFNREQQIKDADANGKSILIEAENSKKAKVEEAKAEVEASELQAQALITRANAAAEATLIEATAKAKSMDIYVNKLGSVDNYMKYIMVDGMYNHGETIYVPTEAGLPILRSPR